LGVDRMSLPRSASIAASPHSPSLSSRCSIRFARATSSSRQRPHPSPALCPCSTRRSTMWLRHRSCPLTSRQTWTSSRYVPFLARPPRRALPTDVVSGLRFECRVGIPSPRTRRSPLTFPKASTTLLSLALSSHCLCPCQCRTPTLNTASLSSPSRLCTKLRELMTFATLPHANHTVRRVLFPALSETVNCRATSPRLVQFADTTLPFEGVP
jgi:hypothetical protein